MLNRVRAVARRVARQLAHDRRFLGPSLIAPSLIIYVSKAALDSFNTGFFDITRFVVPIGAFVVHFITYIFCAIVLVRERTAQSSTGCS